MFCLLPNSGCEEIMGLLQKMYPALCYGHMTFIHQRLEVKKIFIYYCITEEELNLTKLRYSK